MAYHVGRILKQYFDCEVLSIGSPPSDSLFSYVEPYPTIEEGQFLREVTPDDLLICNPSFSARLFGLNLPCRKLSYIQGVRTYAILDVFYDHYVFVSEWVRRFVTSNYGIDAKIIPAFVHLEKFYIQNNWAQRKTVFVLSERKHESLVFVRLREVFFKMYPGVDLPCEVIPVLPQAELADQFRQNRYYLSLDTMEGFGLPMLEAMACGCAVAGWDSGGCNQYARHGENAMLARYGDFEGLAQHLYFLLTHPAEAELMGQAGALKAQQFSIDHFDSAWTRELSAFLGMAKRV